MADTVITNEETEKKGVVVPTVAGAAGLAGGGVAAAQFMSGSGLQAKISAAEKALIDAGNSISPDVDAAASALQAAGKKVNQLNKISTIVEETPGFSGAFKRPFNMLKEDTGTSTKFKIAASAVALAAVLFAGARALSGGKKSFADDETQRRDNPGQSVGTGHAA